MTGCTETLLRQAVGVLDGSEYVPARQRCRAAAHLARQALEDLVSQRCVDLGATMPRATMRSRLVVLRVLGPTACAEPAQAAWEGLTRACHRHAYELAPGDLEVRALIKLVAETSRAT